VEVTVVELAVGWIQMCDGDVLKMNAPGFLDVLLSEKKSAAVTVLSLCWERSSFAGIGLLPASPIWCVTLGKLRPTTVFEHRWLSHLLVAQYFMSDDQEASYAEIRLDRHCSVSVGAFAATAEKSSDRAVEAAKRAVHMFSRPLAGSQVGEADGGAD
jgi:hypothetical protein